MTNHCNITKNCIYQKKNIHTSTFELQSNITIKYIYNNFLPKLLPVATTKIKSEPEHHKHQ